jgi:hypothetical protein
MFTKQWIEAQSPSTLNAIHVICGDMSARNNYSVVPFNAETEVKLVAAGFKCETHRKTNGDYSTFVFLTK